MQAQEEGSWKLVEYVLQVLVQAQETQEPNSKVLAACSSACL